MNAKPPTSTPRTSVRRMPSRGRYDRATIDAILDEALICHVGFVDDAQPYVIPTIHARDGDRLLLHGSKASRMLCCLSAGVEACISVTLLDGLVLARSAFHHSMNYRSVVILGKATPITDAAEKRAALDVMAEHVIAGRMADVRVPTEKELSATTVVFIPITEASAKLRNGPPSDDDADYALDVWAGVIPLAMHAGEPQPDPRLRPGIAVPDYIANYHRPTGGR